MAVHRRTVRICSRPGNADCVYSEFCVSVGKRDQSERHLPAVTKSHVCGVFPVFYGMCRFGTVTVIIYSGFDIPDIGPLDYSGRRTMVQPKIRPGLSPIYEVCQAVSLTKGHRSINSKLSFSTQKGQPLRLSLNNTACFDFLHFSLSCFNCSILSESTK